MDGTQSQVPNPTTRIYARPHVFLMPTRAAYLGPSLPLAPHRNAVATLAVGLDAPFLMSLEDETYQRRRAALIPPGARHHLRGTGRMAFLYLDPLSRDHASLCQTDWLDPPGSMIEALARASDVPGSSTLHMALDRLGIADRSPSDTAVADAVIRLEADPSREWRIADLAHASELSVSRFQHRFADAMGLPFRRYRLWRRLRLAAEGMAAGTSLTTAAMDAGFASSAHFSTSFRTMFGLAPSALRSANAVFHR